MLKNGMKRDREFSQYDAMSSEELENVLRSDVDAPEETETDTERILYIMGVLAERQNADTGGKSVQEAWVSFQQDYLPCEAAAPVEVKPASNGKIRTVCWIRRFAAAAAVFAVVIMCTVAVGAFRYDAWDAIGNWTKNTFYLSKDGENAHAVPGESTNLPFSSLTDMLAFYEEDTHYVPTWIPDGYVMQDIFADETPLQKRFFVYYKKGEKNLTISVSSYIESYPTQIEQDDGYLELYENDGVAYYIISNGGQYHAAWLADSYEYCISGNMELNELKKMIDSINPTD